MNYRRMAGLMFILFPILVQIPFSILSIQFDYPDILRQPAVTILTEFAAGGVPLILTWYAYALSILVFIAGLLWYDRALPEHRIANRIGLVSAGIQLVALLRWTFLVPFLAREMTASSDQAIVSSIAALFTAQHSFLGIGLGEHIGQLTMAIWTFLIARTSSQHVVLRVVGILAATLLVIGLAEHLAVAMQFDPGVLAQGALYGFILWSIWLIGLGVHLVRRPR